MIRLACRLALLTPTLTKFSRALFAVLSPATRFAKMPVASILIASAARRSAVTL